MPSKPVILKPQRHSERERKRQIDKRRGTAKERGYDAQWRRVRLQKLSQHPLCEMHFERGKIVAATVVDHIISIEERPDLRLEMTNLRSLCKGCHDARTAADHGFNRGKRVTARGCDASGQPTDPAHPWNT